MFLYPEHGQCDYIVAFNENSRYEILYSILWVPQYYKWSSDKQITIQ